MLYVGLFDDKDLATGKDKEAVAKAKEQTGLNYTKTQLVSKGKKFVGIKIWVCSVEEYMEG